MATREPAWDWPRSSASWLQVCSLVFLWDSWVWVGALSDSCLLWGHFSSCWIALSSLHTRGHAWSYCQLICQVLLISMVGLTFLQTETEKEQKQEDWWVSRGLEGKEGRRNFDRDLKTNNKNKFFMYFNNYHGQYQLLLTLNTLYSFFLYSVTWVSVSKESPPLNTCFLWTKNTNITLNWVWWYMI